MVSIVDIKVRIKTITDHYKINITKGNLEIVAKTQQNRTIAQIIK